MVNYNHGKLFAMHVLVKFAKRPKTKDYCEYLFFQLRMISQLYLSNPLCALIVVHCLECSTDFNC